MEFCEKNDKTGCENCPIFSHIEGDLDCPSWVEKNPAEAAKIMGYILIDGPPRICDVLGLNVGERFRIDYPNGMTGEIFINRDGLIERAEGNNMKLKIGNSVAYAINHPEAIVRIPVWTRKDIECINAMRLLFGNGTNDWFLRNGDGSLMYGKIFIDKSLMSGLKVNSRKTLFEIEEEYKKYEVQ